ncbi:MAG: hypothetical protein Q8L26_00075 [Candidatus Omnitrophota bacterium]|nr:hypothetical protein [Candidatus Omnitrophota bacterium]
MKTGLKVLLGAMFMLLYVTSLYAQSPQQIVALDPLYSYEIGAGDVSFISVGANFLYPFGPYELSVSGFPGQVNITEKAAYRIAGFIDTRQLPPGDNYLTVVALDLGSGARAQGTIRIRVMGGGPTNKPVIFDPIEQVKKLRVGVWYSLAIGAVDEDGEPLVLNVTGAAANGLGYAKFTKTEDIAGRIGGVLVLQMAKPGELKIVLSARDKRSPYPSNNSVADLHFIVE